MPRQATTITNRITDIYRIQCRTPRIYKLSLGSNACVMNSLILPSLLFYYGLFLILCGIVSVIFIGMKAKTALASGGLSGAIAITIGHFAAIQQAWAPAAGIVVSLGLLFVFSWRSAKTLFKIVELIPSAHPDLKGKCIAFLIISLMAIVSIFTLILQLILIPGTA